MEKKQGNSLAILAFITLGFIWGSNFIYMKLAVNYISPLQLVFFRVFFGFFPVFCYALLTKSLSGKHLRHWYHFVVMGLLATSVYFFGFAKGTSLLLSGVAGAVSGSIPLFSFILAILFIPEEKLSKRKVLGVLIGFVGVLLIGRPSGAELASSNLEGVLYMILGSVSLGASFVYAKKYIAPLHIQASALATYQLGAGLLILSLITDLHGVSAITDSLMATLGVVLGLGLLGTGVAYIIYYYIVGRLGAIAASSVTYIPPIVALMIGAIIVKEPIALVDYFATALIFLGVFLLKRA